MKALYPGSFNPWHKGHANILGQARLIFDQVDVLNVTPETGLLSDHIKGKGYDVIVRGLRNSHDFEHEKSLRGWYEDLGITIPIIFLMCDRGLTHISSSAIREIKRLKK